MDEVTWTTLEFEEQERHADWVWYAGLIAGIVAAISFFYGNIFFGIFAIIAGITIILYSFHSPKPITIVIGEKGVQINHEMIPYEGIKQFWLDESGKQDKLLLLVKTVFLPMVTIPIEGVASQAIREALVSHIPEVLMRDSTSAKLFDRIGF
ncbi:hypothetical protein K2Q02_02470 [Patescibacteria group bacterium]|nr:hypothetical protein [Patescibacteria group bacterium]